MKLPTLPFFLIALTIGGVTQLAPTLSQAASFPTPVAQAARCQQLKDFREIPIQILPKPFDQGCAISTPLRANNPGTIVYVLKTGMRSPTASHGQDLSVQQIAALNRLVERGQAVRITWFRPGTIGSQQWITSIPEDTVFVAWDDLCTRFKPQRVGCVESGVFRPKALTEILVRNRERAATSVPQP
jgi:hypothetical protein